MKTLAIVCAAALAVASLATPASATLGADVSAATMPEAWACMKQSGYEFAIVRAYESVGRPDPVGPHTIYNAWAGGMKHVDVYIFPDPSAGNPGGQFKSMIDSLAGFNIHHDGSMNPKNNTFGTAWLDIEGPQYWSSSHDANIGFIKGLISQASSMGIPLGVYTSESQWTPITGGWTGASNLPLWYAHYDGSPSFGDFRGFGGWSHPAIKQWDDNGGNCGASYDKNFY